MSEAASCIPLWCLPQVPAPTFLSCSRKLLLVLLFSTVTEKESGHVPSCLTCLPDIHLPVSSNAAFLLTHHFPFSLHPSFRPPAVYSPTYRLCSHPSLNTPTHPSILLYIHPSTHAPIHTSICPLAHPSFRPSIHPYCPPSGEHPYPHLPSHLPSVSLSCCGTFPGLLQREPGETHPIRLLVICCSKKANCEVCKQPFDGGELLKRTVK